MTGQLKLSFDVSKTQAKRAGAPVIGIFGRKNTGKSSLINSFAGSELADVSKMSGTTREPKKYKLETEWLGSVMLVDTSGLDDYGEAGEKRVVNTLDVLRRIDFAILLITGNLFAEPEKKMVNKFAEFALPYLIVHNKSDLQELSAITKGQVETAYHTKMVEFSCLLRSGFHELISEIKRNIPVSAYETKSIIGNLFNKNDLVILVGADEMNAPDGMITRSQIEITRDLLDNDCLTLFVRESNLSDVLSHLSPTPRLVVLPSPSFTHFADILPAHIPLTTYGVVMARYKGDIRYYMKNTAMLTELVDGDKVLVLQSASGPSSPYYKEQEEIMDMVSVFTGKKIDYHLVNVSESRHISISQFRFAIICGSFLLTRLQVSYILKAFETARIPLSSFELINAYINGFFQRAITPFV